MTQQDDLWQALEPQLDRVREFVLATVVATSSSAPRPVGTQMAVLADGSVIGSLSGGCIEADVLARAEEVAATGQAELQDYGYSDDTAFGVGLTCGGSIRVHLDRVVGAEFEFYRRLAELIRRGEPVATVTALHGTGTDRHVLVRGDGDDAGADSELAARAREMLAHPRSGTVTASGDGAEYFVRSFGGPDHMVIFGSNAFAAALAGLAKTAGYRVTVCDARRTFATRERFPGVDELVVGQPHEYLAELRVDHRTVLCAMTHDPKFDDPLLRTALNSSAQFIGAMGSRRTSRERCERLRQAGFSERDLARLHAPLGLDLGASSPAETAVSMLAEIISARESGSNLPLTETEGRIHGGDPVREGTA